MRQNLDGLYNFKVSIGVRGFPGGCFFPLLLSMVRAIINSFFFLSESKDRLR